MAALSKAEKAAYNDEIKDIKREVEQIKRSLSEAAVKKKKHPAIRSYYSIEQASWEMDAIDNFLKMNDLSIEMLGIKNTNFLENARKEFYKVLQYMEEVVGNDVDRTLKENDEYLAAINRLNPGQILNFIQRLHRILDNLMHKFGQDSKWKWSFVELQARVAIITKNITSFSEVAKLRDPRSDFFYERRDLMQLCKESLTEAARQFRTKYEMAGKARDDLKRSIEYLSSLRKIHVLFGEDTEATKLKNIIDAAKMALEADDKAKDKDKKDKDKEKESKK
ncbi:MAG: hypothetical protein A2176_06275 [Spirochaetes bacterium RBG_13_51_14]|nr:MAG: hypothetical protein A2176_06275 [Spirochaetes bacterium RBG_13_51_14]